MQPLKNEQGYALVFMTLMIVLLLIMVGMGLDTGHLAYVRSQGQPAVDAAALAAASAVPSGSWSTVTDRAAKFNPGGTNPGTGNNYLDSPNNQISQKNVTLVKYDNATGEFTTSGVNINNANGARVALENTNPYGGSCCASHEITAVFGASFQFVWAIHKKHGRRKCQRGCSEPSSSRTADRSRGQVSAATAGDVELDFQTGGHSTAAWETYQIDNASTTEVRDLWEASCLTVQASQQSILAIVEMSQMA